MNLIDRISYLTIKKILTKEMKKGYYANAANIKDIINLNVYKAVDENFETYTHIENMIIYKNGMVEFNCFNRYMGYAAPPSYLWEFDEKPKRIGKRYVKNRKYK